MKITYFKLENSAGLLLGSNKNIIEIDFSKSKNKLISIQGRNGTGKSCLLSALVPFSGVSSTIDDRGTIPFIKVGKEGYKEIHYNVNGSEIIIKHFYKPTKDGSHSVKSYFSLNGEELNKNGNVSSFNDLVEIHFGLTQDMVRLVRIGSNVNSFINLQPSKRKEYIGKLINEIETYISIYKKINDDLRLAKLLLSTNHNNIMKCNINNLDQELKTINQLRKQLTKVEQQKESIFGEISKNKMIQDQNNLSELTKKLHFNESIISEFEAIQLAYFKIKNRENLINERDKLANELINLQSEMKSNRLQIDVNLNKINDFKDKINKISNSENIDFLKKHIIELKEQTKEIHTIKFNITSNELNNCITTLEHINRSTMIIYSFNNNAINKFIEIKEKNRSVVKFIEKQAKKNILFDRSKFNIMIKQIFSSDHMLIPNCDSEFKDCPFYKLSEIINPSIDDDIIDSETLKQIGIINDHFNNIEIQLTKFKSLDIPPKLKEIFNKSMIFNNMKNKSNLFELNDLNEFMFILKENENKAMLKAQLIECEEKLKFYNDNGIATFEAEIKSLNDSNMLFGSKISELLNKIKILTAKITQLDKDILIINKYKDQYQIIDEIKINIKSLRDKIAEVENINQLILTQQMEYDQLSNEIIELNSAIKLKENAVDNYKMLSNENKILEQKFKELTMIHESVSTKKGIPVIYIKSYLDRIHSFTNKLLEIIYDDSVQIADFIITQDSFEIPFTRNGELISDIKYGSQSELSLISMAISFALLKMSSKTYNILLLDEIDAGLDDENKSLFLEMLKAQIDQINAEQVFIISHNLANGILSIPMDVIKLSETNFNSKMFNVIYE